MIQSLQVIKVRRGGVLHEQQSQTPVSFSSHSSFLCSICCHSLVFSLAVIFFLTVLVSFLRVELSITRIIKIAEFQGLRGCSGHTSERIFWLWQGDQGISTQVESTPEIHSWCLGYMKSGQLSGSWSCIRVSHWTTESLWLKLSIVSWTVVGRQGESLFRLWPVGSRGPPGFGQKSDMIRCRHLED